MESMVKSLQIVDGSRYGEKTSKNYQESLLVTIKEAESLNEIRHFLKRG